jgi:hypothetical protein
MIFFKVSKLLLKTFIFVSLFAFSMLANAGLIQNGDFTTDLNHWHDASDNGSVVYDNGVVNLSTGMGTGLYSAVLVQGDNGFFNFNAPLLIDATQSFLAFDLWQVSRDVDISESGTSSLNDAFNLSIYDAVDSSFDLLFTSLAVTSQQQRFLLDISSLTGRSVAFSFELNDENDGFDTRFALDAVQLTSLVSVPAPGTLLLFALAIGALTRKQLIRK